MQTTITFSDALPEAGAFKLLYDTTNWGPASREAAFYGAALAGSWRSRAAYADGRLIGFVRAISDGRLHAFITEMIIHPDYQGMRIGKALLNALVAQCLAAGITDIQLFCAQGKAEYYLGVGFVVRPVDAPGMQYVGAA